MRGSRAPQRSAQALILALLVALSLGAGAFWWLAANGDPGLAAETERESRGTPTEASLQGTTDVAGHSTSDAAAHATTDRTAVAAAATNTTARPFPTDAEWIEVTVVEGESEQPVADALVGWYSETATEELVEQLGGSRSKLRLLFADAWQVADRVGWQARSDGQGKARVTLKNNTRIAAQKGDLYGELNLQKNTAVPRGGYRLRLAADRTLRVQVLDEAGKPLAGMPVTLTLREADGDLWGGIGWAPLAISEGSEGIATIRHLQSLGQDSLEAGHVRPDGLVAIPCLYMPGLEIEGTKIDVDAPPTEPVPLRMPPSGSIQVRATVQGQPATDFRQVWLSHIQQNEEHDYSRLSGSLTAEVGADGIARFEHVLLGQRWTVQSQSAGGLYKEVDGPVVPGQTIEVELAVDPKSAILAGRLVDAAHQPIAEQTFTFQGHGEEYSNSEEGKTDRDGRFSLAVGTLDEPTQADRLTFDVVKKGERPRRGTLPARVLRPGMETVGDIVLGDAPLIVGGKIVRTGKPAPRDLNLYVQHEVIFPDSPEPDWVYAEDQYHFVGEDGAFEVRGTTGTGKHKLYVAHAEILPMEPIEFLAGRSDLEVVLGTSHALAASVQVHENTHLDRFSFVLEPSDGKPSPAVVDGNDPLLGVLERSGKDRADVRWAAVPPGTYNLQVWCWSREVPLLTIANVVVPQPEPVDPRLAEIDLRGLIRTIEIEVRDLDGEAIHDSMGTLWQARARGPWLGIKIWRSPIHVTLPRGPYDLVLGIDGWQPQYVRGDAEKCEVRMVGWRRIPVTLVDVPKLPTGIGVYGRLEATAPGAEPFRMRWGDGGSSHYMEANSHVDLLANALTLPIGDGPHRLNIYMHDGRNTATMEVASPTQVLSTDERIRVRIVRAEWERAIKAMTATPQEGGR